MGGADTVHVVDDDEPVCDSLRVLLEAWGFVVHTHTSAAAFLAAASRLGGWVLIDVRMPEMDGLELQTRLNELGLRLPAIVMTGQGAISR
jgi:two-component system response regulator FixJ